MAWRRRPRACDASPDIQTLPCQAHPASRLPSPSVRSCALYTVPWTTSTPQRLSACPRDTLLRDHRLQPPSQPENGRRLECPATKTGFALVIPRRCPTVILAPIQPRRTLLRTLAAAFRRPVRLSGFARILPRPTGSVLGGHDLNSPPPSPYIRRLLRRRPSK